VAAIMLTQLHYTESLRVEVDAAVAETAQDDVYPGARALTSALSTTRFGPAVRDEPEAPSPLPLLTDARDDTPDSTADGCFAAAHEVPRTECDYGDPDGPRTVVLAGGSHAEHLLPALDAIGRERGVKIRTMLKASCPLRALDPAALEEAEPNEQACGRWLDETFDRIAEEDPDAVLTTSTRPRGEDALGDHVPDDYIGAFDRITAARIPVVGVRDNPWTWGPEVRDALDCRAESASELGSVRDRSDALDPIDPAPAAYPGLARRDLVTLLDFTDLLCTDEVCPAEIGNVVVYRDSDHLTATYVRTMTPFIDEQLCRRTDLCAPRT